MHGEDPLPGSEPLSHQRRGGAEHPLFPATYMMTVSRGAPNGMRLRKTPLGSCARLIAFIFSTSLKKKPSQESSSWLAQGPLSLSK
mmetsp:Transcript_127981/g.398517  ORF Transcript_127981/g.398517 Transcript_127981/m.398517 type:complete len:86 (+) Transcript_127981:233-490(+)